MARVVVLAVLLLVGARPAGAGATHRVYLPSVGRDGASPVYVVYGQSNAVGAGRSPQPYGGPALMWRGAWVPLADPVGGRGGSFVPRLATRLGTRARFVAAAVGSQPIASEVPGTAIYAAMVAAARAGGAPARAVLFWQGETDVGLGTDGALYRARLADLAAGVATDLGAPLVVAEVGNGPPELDYGPVRRAQRACWASCPNVLSGPSFADVWHAPTGEWHFLTDEELTLAGDRWYAALVAHGATP